MECSERHNSIKVIEREQSARFLRLGEDRLKTFLTSFLGWSHTLMQAILYTIPMAPLDLSSHLALMRGQLFPAIPSDPQAHTQDKFSAFELVGWKKRLFSHLVMLKILTWMTALISGVGGYDDGVDGDDGDEAE